MKKIALILDGIVAKNFLDLVLRHYSNHNFYIVVVKDESLIPKNYPSTFAFYCFDATSSFRLLQVLNDEVSDLFLIMQDFKEQRIIHKIIQTHFKRMRVVLSVKRDNEKEHDEMHVNEKLVLIDEFEVLANKFISRLPNIPSTPREFGLGKGEIMEIGVPFGSIFAYRHIGSIRQKEYRIVGLYRNDALLLATKSLVIQPRDILLVAGNPEILNAVYLQVKSNVGQFPAPFGKSIYLYIDMRLQSRKAMMRDVYQALFLHKHLKSYKLYIQVLHPTSPKFYHKFLALETESIEVNFDFYGKSFIQKLHEDHQKKMGLIVVGRELFLSKKHRKALYKTATPVYKTNASGLSKTHQSVVVLNESLDINEDMSSVIFDVSMQMDLGLLLYDFDPNKRYKNEIVNHYENLANALNRKIEIFQTDTKNPIMHLNSLKDPILHFMPFEECITHTRFWWFLSTKVEKLAFLNDDNPQIFIPIAE
ncbi:COG3400 family protein [Helicobacter pylori]|uniref:COG3400 family protein n=1 Tax=Helicobacter pylori TaxID=210 RepID=UPI00165C3939|nr:COG3400 family protein [Helicobacter pylori]WQS21212.1 COG3400 family protein [Helicobacter pylori]WQS30550.1 COG3400 family protein [Helicobacter pylori]